MKKFKNEKDIQQALLQFLTSRDKAFFKNGITNCHHWQEVINDDGNYIIQLNSSAVWKNVFLRFVLKTDRTFRWTYCYMNKFYDNMRFWSFHSSISFNRGTFFSFSDIILPLSIFSLDGKILKCIIVTKLLKFKPLK